MKMKPKKLKVISEGLQHEGVVTVEYTIEDNRGSQITLRVHDSYVPLLSSDLWLLYPQEIQALGTHR